MGEKVMDLPPSLAVIARVAVVPDLLRVAVSEEGLPGSAPPS